MDIMQAARLEVTELTASLVELADIRHYEGYTSENQDRYLQLFKDARDSLSIIEDQIDMVENELNEVVL